MKYLKLGLAAGQDRGPSPYPFLPLEDLGLCQPVRLKPKRLKDYLRPGKAKSALLLLGPVEVRWGWAWSPTPSRASSFLLRSPTWEAEAWATTLTLRALGTASYSGLESGWGAELAMSTTWL